MKKLFFLLAISLSFSASSQALYPFGEATAITVSPSGTSSFTVTNNMNVVTSVPTLTANATVSVTPGTYLKVGAKMVLVIKTTATETTTFAGSIVGPVVTGVAGKTWSQAFIYNGTNFYPCGAKIQVD